MIIYCFSINKRGKYMASKHWKIISARYRISEEDLGFAPVVGEIELENENGKRAFYTNDEFDGMPTFLKTKTSVLDLLASNNEEDQDKIQQLLDHPINKQFEYEEILSNKRSSLYLVYRYLTYLVRSEKEDTEKFTQETIGKYLDEIVIPKSDIEEDMEEE